MVESQPSFTLKLNATHSQMDMRLQEIRFDTSKTIRQVKEQLERKFGTDAGGMKLELRDTKEQPVAEMSDDLQTLAHYQPQNHYTIHVVDESGSTAMNEWEDVSKVEKYEISDENYAKRGGNIRDFKKKMMAANPNFMNAAGESSYTDFMKEEAALISVGQRCQLNVGERRGEVKFVGKCQGLGAGYWVGAQLDEPTGDSNGTVKGKQLFDCQDKFAAFVRPNEL